MHRRIVLLPALATQVGSLRLEKREGGGLIWLRKGVINRIAGTRRASVPIGPRESFPYCFPVRYAYWARLRAFPPAIYLDREHSKRPWCPIDAMQGPAETRWAGKFLASSGCKAAPQPVASAPAMQEPCGTTARTRFLGCKFAPVARSTYQYYGREISE